MRFEKGHIPWDKGLTKENSPKKLASIEKGKLTRKRKFASGELVPWQKGKQLVAREIRKCQCGHCTETFECLVTSVKRFVKGHTHRGRKHTEERKQHIAKIRTGTKQSKESGQKRRATRAVTDQKNGYHNSPETIQKMRVSAVNRMVSREQYQIPKTTEVKMKQILIDLDIYFIHQLPVHRPKGSFIIDFYIPSVQAAFETDGKFWHADPRKYKATDKMYTDLKTGHRFTAQEIWDKDKFKQEELEAEGYQVVRFWDGEFTKESVAKALNDLALQGEYVEAALV